MKTIVKELKTVVLLGSIMYVRGPFSTGPKILQISSSRSGASYPHDGKGKKFFTYHKFRTGAVATTEQQTACRQSALCIGYNRRKTDKTKTNIGSLFLYIISANFRIPIESRKVSSREV